MYYIKNGRYHMGDISFAIPQDSYLRETNETGHDLIVLTKNMDTINARGNWFIEWGAMTVPSGDPTKGLLLFDDDITECTTPPVLVHCGNMDGVAMAYRYKNDDKQYIAVCFPLKFRDCNVFRILIEIVDDGTPGLESACSLKNEKIVQDLFRSLWRDNQEIEEGE